MGEQQAAHADAASHAAVYVVRYFEVMLPSTGESAALHVRIVRDTGWQIDDGTDAPRLITLYPG
jgi:hypothetical protein